MGTATKIRKSLSGMVICLVLALLCANMNTARCFNSIQTGDWGNSNYSTATPTTPTRRVEYVIDDEEEFLMDSEVNRRILADGRGRRGIGYGALRGGQPICSSSGRYSNCLPNYNRLSRPCTVENRCARHG